MNKQEFSKIEQDFKEAKQKANRVDMDRLSYELAVHQVRNIVTKYGFKEQDKLDALMNAFKDEMTKRVEETSNIYYEKKREYVQAQAQRIEQKEEKEKEFVKKVVDKEAEKREKSIKMLVDMGYSREEAEKIIDRKG
ncbi:MAG: hypothetical protein II604_07600 [Bacteroidales bacterium]|nr:hypothetical protein [Bacteroidales bacterium]